MINAGLSALLWCWIALQFAYWTFIYVGVRRFDRTYDSRYSSAARAELSIVIPAYNEAVHLSLITGNLKKARIAGIDVILVDDGSCDGSADLLACACEEGGARLLRHPNNRGKAAALCSGLETASTGIIMTLDADTILPLPPIVNPRISPEIGAIAFTILPLETDRFLGFAQSAEYAYILNLERLAFAGFGIMLTVPGAASLWRTDALRHVGGFSARTWAEDTDATMSLQLAGWRMAIAPEITAKTACPATLSALVRQRARWIWGNLHAAYYAATACLDRRSVRLSAAIALMAASIMMLAGYAIATLTMLRFALLDIVWSDIIASIVLCAATLARIVVSRRIRPSLKGQLLSTLIALLAMQAVNLAGFWAGMFTRGRRW